MKLEQGEQIVREVSKHWFVLFSKVIFLAVFVIIPPILYILLRLGGIDFSTILEGNTGFLFAGATALWFLIIWINFFVIWTNYHLDVLILTTDKVIDVNQHALFYRDISTCRLDRIQDVTVEVRGIIPSLLDFGRITIQTAGEEDNFIINGMPKPYDVKEAILAQAHQAIESWRPNTEPAQLQNAGT